MRRNRKRHVSVQAFPPSIAGLALLMVVLTLGYWFIDSRCNQLGQEIRKHEQKFSSLENERVREEARWNAKKTPEKLEQAMLQHGLEMNYPTAAQVVRMDTKNGQPIPGQIALAKFHHAQNAGERVARTQPK